MIKINIKNFVEYLYNKDDETIQIPDEIVNCLQREGLSELEALEKSEKLECRIKRLILKKLKDYKSQGITPKYKYDESNDERLVRIDLAEDSKEGRDIRKIINLKEQFLEILKKITWQEFEKVCLLILRINNLLDCNVTRASKDGGIDIFAWMKGINGNSRRIERDVKIRVVGQGKHTSSDAQVSNADLSEFVTDIEKLRRKQGFSLFVLPQAFIESPFPLLPIFITNGNYCGDAIKTAENYGIILWNGEQISEDIATYFDLSPFIIDGNINAKKLRIYISNL